MLFSYKLACVDNKFSKTIVVFSGKNVAYRLNESIVKEYEHCKKVMKKHSTKSWSWLKKKKKTFNQVTHAGHVKNSLKMKK